MRFFSWILSLILHVCLALTAYYLATPLPMKVRLDVPVYHVDLVKLAPRKGVAAPKPKPAVKQAEAAVAKPIPKPAPKPTAKEIAPAKAKPKPKPKAEVAPKKAPKPKPKKKPAPEKPKKTREQLLNEALRQAKLDVKWKKRLERKSMEQELADLRKQVALQDAKDKTQGAGGTADEGVNAGLEEIYAAQVKAIIQENWRFPSIPVDSMLMATVYLRVGPDGSITESRLLATSGRPDFDSSVMKAVDETKGLPQPPGNVNQIRINFNLQDMQ